MACSGVIRQQAIMDNQLETSSSSSSSLSSTAKITENSVENKIYTHLSPSIIKLPHLFCIKVFTPAPLIFFIYEGHETLGELLMNSSPNSNLNDIKRYCLSTKPAKNTILTQWINYNVYVLNEIVTQIFESTSALQECIIFSTYAPLSYLITFAYLLKLYNKDIYQASYALQYYYGYQAALFNVNIVQFIIPELLKRI